MCDENCIGFLKTHLPTSRIPEARVLEAGSRDVNGSIRQYVEGFCPASYLGIDLQAGPLVDEICDVTKLVDRFGLASFQMVLSTEMMEHVLDWRRAIENLKQVLEPGGILGLTTRSIGFPFHEFPGDYWRFETHDFEMIFADFEIISIERLPANGVGIVARKPKMHLFTTDLRKIELYRVRPEHVE